MAVAAHHLHLDTLCPCFLPIPTGLAHWAILIGLSIVCGKSRPLRPGWYGMVWHKSSSTVQGDEIINFGGQEVKRQGYTTPKLHLETWQRHHSRPIGSSRFSSWELSNYSWALSKNVCSQMTSKYYIVFSCVFVYIIKFYNVTRILWIRLYAVRTFIAVSIQRLFCLQYFDITC